MIPPGEQIIETKQCRISGKEFHVTDKDLEFYEKVSPIFVGKKYSIPSPTLCPEERMRLIMSFINQRHLHRIPSSLSGNEIISDFGLHRPFPVYSVSEWYSDVWDPRSYKKAFSFESAFFPQFENFISKIPHWALSQGSNNENSEYCNHGNRNRSCYLLMTGSDNEHVYYATFVYKSIHCMDCEYVKESELCYECTDIQKGYGLFWCVDCSNCTNGYFLKNCSNCQGCFGCCNLSGKKFHIMNQDVGEKKFKEFVSSYLSYPSEKRAEIFHDIKRLWESSPQPAMHGYSNEGVHGDFIYNSSHVFNSFEIKNSEHIKNCVSMDGVTDTYDCLLSRNSSWNYFCSLATHSSSYTAFGSSVIGEGARVYYSDTCVGISDCFACSGLHSHEHHCVLNTAYSTQEYEVLCGKIIDHMRSTGEWGEFFPQSLSPFDYNETPAQEYFPFTKQEALQRGFRWHDELEKKFEGSSFEPLPISQYDEKIVGFEIAQKNIDQLLGGTIKCKITEKPFKIVRQELAFYIEHSLPIPTKHPDQRHKERMEMRNGRTLFERKCAECNKDITTTYSPDRPERVVCEECYRKIVY